jgi:hypothetical protein
MKSIAFWDVTPGSTVEVHRCSEKHIAFIFKIEEYSK